MGNKLSRTESKEESRKKYMRVVEKRKRRYARQKSMCLGSPLTVVSAIQDWREPILQALELAEEEVDWAYWPQDLIQFIRTWDSGSDSKWRSNVLWFDYLRTFKAKGGVSLPTTFSTLKIPITPLFSTDMHAKSLLEHLRGHFANPATHAIAGMIQTFADSFTDFYIDATPQLFSTNFQLTVDILNPADAARILNEVKTFLSLALSAFNSYYGGMDFTAMVKEKAMDVRLLLVDEVMHTKVHEVLLRVMAMANGEREAVYAQKLKDLGDLTCEQLGIDPFFCIDKPRPDLPSPASFRRAIESLRELTTVTSPIGKLDVVIQTTRRLCECIDDYWKSDSSISPEQLVINADQILSIFVFVVLKAKVKNLMEHVKLMIEFVRMDVQQGTCGYYLATLEASIEHILMLEGPAQKGGIAGKGNESFYTCEGD